MEFQHKLFNEALILAGGKSSRFGSDKTLMPFKDSPTITHFCFAKLEKIFGSVLVSAKSQKFSPPLPLLKDEFSEFAPIFVLASLAQFKTPVFIQPSDSPNISQSTIITLFDALKDNHASIAVCGGKEHFLTGFFRPSIATLAKAQIAKNELSIHALLNKAKVAKSLFTDENEFLNINTKEDLKALLS